MDIEQLAEQVETQRKAMLNMRADLMAYRVVLAASFIAMNAPARTALRHNVQRLSEQTMAAGLAHSRSADDSSLHAQQAAFDRVLSLLDELPAS